MTQLLIHLPDYLAGRFRSLVPAKQRSKYIENLLEEDLKKRDDELRRCAIDVELDDEINATMDDWDIVSGDGLDEDK
jgi:hypothetical protein